MIYLDIVIHAFQFMAIPEWGQFPKPTSLAFLSFHVASRSMEDMSNKMNVKMSLAILASFAIIAVWYFLHLDAFTVPLFGGAIFLYMLSSLFGKRKADQQDESMTVFTITVITLLLIFMTGKLESELFFLLYFLCFAVAFLAKPYSVFLFTTLTVLVLLPTIGPENMLTHAIKLASLLLLSPVAFFLGRAFQQIDRDERMIANLEKTSADTGAKIKQDVAKIITNDSQALGKEDIKILEDIVDQTDVLEQKTS